MHERTSADGPAPSRAAGALSLEGLHGSVPVPPPRSGRLAQARAFIGPALLVGVGYMDPGNWATDLQAGAGYGYGLLWVVALASAMAIVLQLLAVRLGLATGRDLARACRDWYPHWTQGPNWLLAEIAIAACDLAELLGSAVALSLLFDFPLLLSVAITAADVLLLLLLQRRGMRTIEALVLLLVATIVACYAIELFALPGTRPDAAAIGHALAHPALGAPGMAMVAVGIVGATVMPHNLYLHSALVQTRQVGSGAAARARAIGFNTLDTVLALGLAFLVNAAILMLAAIVFHGRAEAAVAGHPIAMGPDSDWIRIAFLTLSPLLGTAAASILFAVALLAAGQSSTITGTLAGQVVMEGFLDLRLAPWKRRLLTRAAAIVPAVLLIAWRGDGSVTGLLVLSQAVLALQLPFAMIPLLHFTSRRRYTGRWRSGPPLLALGWTSALLIIALDLYALPDTLRSAGRILFGN